MLWRYDGEVKCPRCDSRASVVSEKSTLNGSISVRYLLKCFLCGYRSVLQELTITKSGDKLKIRVAPPVEPTVELKK
ncbi:MAG: hypothetical protein RMH84_01205 [Sulfolobales archaeon]|nr:hypothetical protein [Sulfolobales archaeon]MCX8208841.1 hypothetical protein [Sulfolobales archaeon]MDW8010204.1 hypothetical protein [Sulfolobales archaeon]